MKFGEMDFSRFETQEEFLKRPREEQEKDIDIAKNDAISIDEKRSEVLKRFDAPIVSREFFQYLSTLPDSVVFSQKVQSAAVKSLTWCLLEGSVPDVLRTVRGFKLSEDVFLSQEVQAAAKKKVIESFSKGHPDSALQIIQELKLSDELLKSQEVQAAAKQGMVQCLTKRYVDNALKIARIFKFSTEENQLVEQILSDELLYGNIDKAQKIIVDLKLPKEDVKRIVTQAITNSFYNGRFEKATNLIGGFKFTNEEIQSIAEQVSIEALSRGSIDIGLRITKMYKLSDDFLLSQEVNLAAKEGLVSILSQGYVDEALRIANTFKFTNDFLFSEEVQSVAKEGLVSSLSRNDVDEALRIANTFKFTNDFLFSEEVQSVAKRALTSIVPFDDFQAAMRRSTQIFGLTKQDIRSIIREGLVDTLLDRPMDDVFSVWGAFSFSDSDLLSQDVQTAAKGKLIDCLNEGEMEMSFKVAELFKLTDEILFSQEVQKAFGKFKFPTSFKGMMEIFQLDRFGMNLINKFNSFDVVAARAVSKILIVDEQTPSLLDRRSLEYRQVVQGELYSFERNEDIIRALQEKGINIDVWLNYEKVKYFELGEAEEISFGQKISQPVERLPESISYYVNSILGAVSEYKKELVDKKIREDVTSLNEEIQKMEALIEREKDEKKKSGMQRGIESLKARIANPKEIRVWDKLTSEISKLVKLAQEVCNVNEKLIKEETVQININDQVALENSLRHKAAIWEIRRKLMEDLNKLKNRSDEVFQVYEHTLTLAIGRVRAEGVMQQVKHEIREHQDHLTTDFDTIFSFIQEDMRPREEDVVDGEEIIDDEGYKFNSKTAKSLEGRPMSIRIGGRSRQDLYLGNYTTCCIRIDSDFHEAESPIADYVTDLGMQNVILYDEVTKTPVACAWCWLGVDTKTGETSFVIDNVEGWQKYTINFQEQLERELRLYLNEYAEKVRSGGLSQGQSFNDLNVTSEEEQQDERYIKIGGYNRASGYYLEAELSLGEL